MSANRPYDPESSDPEDYALPPRSSSTSRPAQSRPTAASSVSRRSSTMNRQSAVRSSSTRKESKPVAKEPLVKPTKKGRVDTSRGTYAPLATPSSASQAPSPRSSSEFYSSDPDLSPPPSSSVRRLQSKRQANAAGTADAEKNAGRSRGEEDESELSQEEEEESRGPQTKEKKRKRTIWALALGAICVAIVVTVFILHSPESSSGSGAVLNSTISNDHLDNSALPGDADSTTTSGRAHNATSLSGDTETASTGSGHGTTLSSAGTDATSSTDTNLLSMTLTADDTTRHTAEPTLSNEYGPKTGTGSGDTASDSPPVTSFNTVQPYSTVFGATSRLTAPISYTNDDHGSTLLTTEIYSPVTGILAVGTDSSPSLHQSSDPSVIFVDPLLTSSPATTPTIDSAGPTSTAHVLISATTDGRPSQAGPPLSWEYPSLAFGSANGAQPSETGSGAPNAVEESSVPSRGSGATPSLSLFWPVASETSSPLPGAPQTIMEGESRNSTKWYGTAAKFSDRSRPTDCGVDYQEFDLTVALSQELRVHIWNEPTNQTRTALVVGSSLDCVGSTDLTMSGYLFQELAHDGDDEKLQVQWWFDDASVVEDLDVDLSKYEVAKGSDPAVYETTAIFWKQDGWTGACGQTIAHDSMYMGLPLGLWPDPTVRSNLCGRKITVKNVAGSKLKIQDAANRTDYATFTKGAFEALGGDLDAGELAVSFSFSP
ncbi:hypothetical protein JCM10212_000103 [Sporobolomyces blumeae]